MSRSARWSAALFLSVTASASGVSFQAALQPADNDAIGRRIGVAAFVRVDLDLPDSSDERFWVSVPIDGAAATIELSPYSLRGNVFVILKPDGFGELVPVEAPPRRTFRGEILGKAGSVVAASLSDRGLKALILLPDGRFAAIEPLAEIEPGASRSAHVVYRGEDTLACRAFCAALDATAGGSGAGGRPGAGTGLKIVDIAAEADWPYFQLLGGSLSATVDDIEFTLNATEAVYERDVQITFEVTTIVIRARPEDDPYSNTTSLPTFLSEVAAHWNAARNDVQRDVVQVFSGRVFGGAVGIAFNESVCALGSAYSVVRSRFTSNLGLRTALSAHELGHAFSATHCNADPECHIMCAGIGGCDGVNGANLKFDAHAIDQITSFRDTRSCLDDLADPRNLPFVETFSDTFLRKIRWSYNKNGQINPEALDPPSPPFAVNLDTAAEGNVYNDELRSNCIRMARTSGAVLEYWTEHRGVEPGEALVVEYWSRALRWVELERVVSDGVDQERFERHVNPINDLDAYHDEFRLRFRTEVDEPNDDFYIDDVRLNGTPCEPCDANCDGNIDAFDIEPFIDLLFGGGQPCGPCAGDADRNGRVDAFDIEPLLNCLFP